MTRHRTGFRDLLMRRYSAIERQSHELLYLFLGITAACNLSCLHCGSDCGRKPAGKRIDTESWIRIINHMSRRHSKAAIVLTGGEPLLHPQLDRITAALSKAGSTWGLVTNGTLLNAEIADSFISDGMASITISLDGPANIHDWLRNRHGVFDDAVRALRLIGSRSIRHADVVTCVTPRVLGRLDETARIILESGIQEWRLFRIFPAGRARNNRELLLDPTETRALLRWIREARKRYRSDGLLVSYACEGWIPQGESRRIRDPLSYCRAGIHIASILSDGTVTGCPNNDTRFHVGSVTETDFDEIWEHRFDSFRRRGWLDSTGCSGCQRLTDCRGSSIHLWRDGEDDVAFCYMH